MVRVPRGAYTANGSKMAGDAYDSHGPSGSTDEGRLKDFSRLWEGIWRHDLKDELRAAHDDLTSRGALNSS